MFAKPRLIIAALIALVVPVAAITRAGAGAPAGGARTLTVEQLLAPAASSHDILLSWATQKVEELAAILAEATDEAAAQRVRSAAERCYLEMELIGVRITMLPRPADAELSRLQPLAQRFEQARARLAQQCLRIRTAPALANPLRGVIEPTYAQLRGASVAKAASILSQLQTLRSQIELYKLQHRDRAPDFRQHGWAQLTGRTDAGGAVELSGPFGPYLPSPPINPLTRSSTILIVRSHPKATFRYDKGDCGFVYDESSGRIWALDIDGRLFDESAAVSMSK